MLAFTQLRAITLRTRRIRYLCNTHPPFKLKVKLCFLFQEWKKVVRALVSSKLFRRLWRNRKLILFFNLWTAAAKNSHYSKQCDKYYSVKSLQRAMCLLRRRSGPNQIKSLQKYLDIFTVLRVFRGWLKFCSSSKKSLANLTDDTRKIICRKWLEHWRMHHCHRVNFLVNEFSRVEKRCHRRKVREVLDNWLHIYKFRQYFSHYRQKKRYFHHFIRRLRERAKVGLMFHLANVAARFGSKQMRRALMTLKAYSGVRKMLQQNFILLQRRSRSTLASKFLNIWIKSFTLRQKFYTVHKFIIDRKLSTIFGRWVPTKANISSVLSMPHCDGRISSGVYSTACKDVFRDNTISDDEIESPDFFDEWCAEYWQLVTSKRLSCRLRHALRDWQRYTIARHALKSAFRKAKDSENKSCFSRKWNRWIVMFLRSLQGRIAQCSGQMLQSFERRTSLLASSTTRYCYDILDL